VNGNILLQAMNDLHFSHKRPATVGIVHVDNLQMRLEITDVEACIVTSG
jgi:hypothetical protein